MLGRCDGCGTSLVTAKYQVKGYSFCTAECHDRFMLAIAAKFPPDELMKHVMEMHQGPCMKCGGEGPNDIYEAQTVISAIILTLGSSKTHACCKKCGSRAVLGASAISAVAGWWGIPWGLATPIQIMRNLFQLSWPPKAGKPSQDFIEYIGIQLATSKVRPKGMPPQPAQAQAVRHQNGPPANQRPTPQRPTPQRPTPQRTMPQQPANQRPSANPPQRIHRQQKNNVPRNNAVTLVD